MIKSLFLAISIIAHDPGYYTSLANHIKRWLSNEGVAANVITPKDMSSALERERLAFLVGFGSPTASELATLKKYRQRGGKLVVFYSASPELAKLMDVVPIGYATAPYPGAWSRMDFVQPLQPGFPARIRQTSTVLLKAKPVKGRGRVIATWSDRMGRSTGEAAWIATGAGYWMTHVLLADGDEDLKEQLLGAIVGVIDPKLWSVSTSQARARQKRRVWRELALRQSPRAGEIHAVWDHSGCGLYPGDWPRTMRMLQAAHVTDIFVNVAGAGFAHYPSRILPKSKTFEQEGDQLAKCLAAAKDTGIRVHAWVLTFSATRASPATLDSFAAKGWRLKLPSGKQTEYLDPSNAAVRAYMLSVIDEIQTRYPSVSGIHLDFIRWGDGVSKPADAVQSVSRFVADARRKVKRPRWLTTAVYGKYPNCVSTVGQDWESWLDMNLVDYVVPMDYTESLTTLTGFLQQHAKTKAHARKIIVGIGVTANESRLDAKQVIDQINLSRAYRVAGNSLFDLDVTLETQILPYLRLGIW